MSSPWSASNAREYLAEPWKQCPFLLKINSELKCKATESKVKIESADGGYSHDGGYYWYPCKRRQCLLVLILDHLT